MKRNERTKKKKEKNGVEGFRVFFLLMFLPVSVSVSLIYSIIYHNIFIVKLPIKINEFDRISYPNNTLVIHLH